MNLIKDIASIPLIIMWELGALIIKVLKVLIVTLLLVLTIFACGLGMNRLRVALDEMLAYFEVEIFEDEQ